MSPQPRHRRGVVPAGSEDAFSTAVQQLAGFHGWRGYHTHRSDRSAAGFPDWTFVRAQRLVFAELKKTGAAPNVRVAEAAQRPEWLRNRAISNAQASWLEALREVQDAVDEQRDGLWDGVREMASVEVYVWTPADWPEIERILA